MCIADRKLNTLCRNLHTTYLDVFLSSNRPRLPAPLPPPPLFLVIAGLCNWTDDWAADSVTDHHNTATSGCLVP